MGKTVVLHMQKANYTYMVSNDIMTHLREELLICGSDIIGSQLSQHHQNLPQVARQQ